MGKVRIAVVLALVAVMLFAVGQVMAQEGTGGGGAREGQGMQGAREGQGTQGAKEGMQGAKQGMQGACPMCMMCKDGTQTITDVDKLLSEAKTAADAGNAAEASLKIQQAQEKMKAHSQKMKDMQTKSGGKCPMCGMKMDQQGQGMQQKQPMREGQPRGGAQE